MKIKTDYRWIIKVVLIAVVATSVFTLASTEVIGRAGYAIAVALLLLFIAIGIAFDIIGVAVAAADEAPLHSMAAHKERGAVEALRLVRSADKVSSFCNDVVGDVAGIVSGATAALIAERLIAALGTGEMLTPFLISAAVTALTVGGKAFAKTFAFNNSTLIVHSVGKMLRIFTKRTK